jgi:RNA-directed DNA polymerase
MGRDLLPCPKWNSVREFSPIESSGRAKPKYSHHKQMTFERLFYDLNRKQCESYVFQLQQEIAVACMQNGAHSVLQLQHKLIPSNEARALSVFRVVTNPGGQTPGVDGVVWTSSKDIMDTMVRLKDLSKYKAQPVRRVHIPKASGGQRPLGIPTMYDRAVQTLYNMAL